MVAICNTLVFLVLVPQAVGQGFLRSKNASQDASQTPQATSNLGSVSQDDLSDSELRGDLQSEAIALQKDVNGEAGEAGDEEAAKEYEQKFSNADADQLEDKVDELQGELDQRDAESQSRLAEESQAAEENGSKTGNSDTALVQSGVDDAPPSSDEDDEDAQTAGSDPDETDVDTGDVDHDALLLQDVTRLQDHLSQRHSDRSKDNELLEQMVAHLLDEAAAAKQAEKHADPEVILVLLQTLKKHTTIFGKQASKHRIHHGAGVALTDELGYRLSHEGDDEGMDQTNEGSEDDSAEDESDTDADGDQETNDETNEEVDTSEDGDEEEDAVDDETNDGNADPDSFGVDEVSVFDTGEDLDDIGADTDEAQDDSQALDFDVGQE